MTNSLVASHALEDVSSAIAFEDEEVDVKQLAKGLAAGMETGSLGSRTDLRPGPHKGPKPFQDVPLPPPERPLKWQTKLADRATAAVSLEAHYQVPPHLLFDLLADPNQHDKIFDAILAADAELLEEDGSRRKWRLDYTARWNFWKVSGVCENRLWMWTDGEAGTVTFKLREPGFLKRYEGTWTITAGCGSALSEFSTPSAAMSPAGIDFNLTSSSSGSSSSSRGSSPASSPRSTGSSWADTAPTVDMFGAGLSRGGSGHSSGSSISMRTLPLASVTAAAASTAGLPQTVSQSVSTAAATLGGTLSTDLWKWFGQPANATQAATNTASGSNSAVDEWPPLFKASASQDNTAGSSSRSSSGSGVSSIDSFTSDAPKLRPMPTSCIITASTLTSPKLTPHTPEPGPEGPKQRAG